LFLRNLGLTTPFRADVLAPCAPAEWQISDFINAWIEFNHLIQADKTTMLRVIGCAA